MATAPSCSPPAPAIVKSTGWTPKNNLPVAFGAAGFTYCHIRSLERTSRRVKNCGYNSLKMKGKKLHYESPRRALDGPVGRGNRSGLVVHGVNWGSEFRSVGSHQCTDPYPPSAGSSAVVPITPNRSLRIHSTAHCLLRGRSYNRTAT